MRKVLLLNLVIYLFILIFISSIFAQPRTNNSISGFILDAKDRSPVSDIYVELLNDTYSTLSRIKTNGSGRFFFGGISSGNFKIRVLPYGTNYAQQEQDVEIINNRIGSAVTSDSVYIDIYLVIDKRKVNAEALGSPGTVFIQDIPERAKELYKKALSNFEKNSNTDIGIENLTKALEIFPEYYDVLNRLSSEYIKKKRYYDSLPYLIKAIKINSRSYSAYYMLGVAAYNIKEMKQALEAFKIASIINPQSVYALIQYGMMLRINENYKEAEEKLLRAVNLSKKMPIPENHWQLALLYDKINRYEEAAKQLEIYLKLQPDSGNDKKIKELISIIRAKGQKTK